MRLKKKRNFRKGGNGNGNDFEPIPTGWYDLSIVKDETKTTRDGTGKRLVFEIRVVKGKYKNRRIFVGLNIENKSETAQEIAWQHFDRFCCAIFDESKSTVKASEELHGKTFQGLVTIKKGDGEYRDQNEIKGWKPKGESTDDADDSDDEEPDDDDLDF